MKNIPDWLEKVEKYGDAQGSEQWARSECEFYHFLHVVNLFLEKCNNTDTVRNLLPMNSMVLCSNRLKSVKIEK